MTYKSASKLIEAIRANQLYVTDEVVHSAADRISTLIKERDAEKARAEQAEAERDAAMAKLAKTKANYQSA